MLIKCYCGVNICIIYVNNKMRFILNKECILNIIIIYNIDICIYRYYNYC